MLSVDTSPLIQRSDQIDSQHHVALLRLQDDIER
jgi:hypothetical protein